MRIPTREERIKKWCLKMPYGQRCFAIIPVRVYGEKHLTWLEWLYRYRFEEYNPYWGSVKGFIYERDSHRDGTWTEFYYGSLKKEIK